MSFATHAIRTLTLALLAVLSSPVAAQTQTPFTGMPIMLPGIIEAENFDNGGEGVAYHDNVAGNAGGQYRTGESVDIIVTRDPAGGSYSVNNFETGEWLEYTVDIQAAGQHEIAIRTANGGATPTSFRVEIDGANVTGSVPVPPTGGWSAYQWVAKAGVSLPAGRHVLRLVSEQQWFDVNQIRVTATPTTPFVGVIPLPGTFEAENFDNGGEGIAYHDNVVGNAGGQYRTTESVDIKASSDTAGGGYLVTNFETGEWLVYTVNVATSGLYDIDLRVSSGTFTTSAFRIEIDGANVTGSVVVPATGSFDTFQWVGKKGVALTAGQHVLKLVSEQQYFDVNQIRVTAVTHTPFSGTPISLPGTFEAEDFDLGGEGNAYHDNVAGNAGGQYRTSESVDIKGSSDIGGGFLVTNFETGEWLVYTVNVATSGLYDIDLRLSSGTSGTSAFHVEIDGANVTGSVVVPATGSFDTFQWVGKKGVPLTAGQHVLKLVSDQQYFDVNQIRVVASVPSSGEVRFSCSFESGWTQCGFTEQAKVIGQRATLVNFGRDGVKAVRLHTEPGDNNVSGSGSGERNDLRLGNSPSYCNQGQEEWWAHSILFPNDFVVPSNGTYMDFHHTGSTGQANFHVVARASTGLRFIGFGGATVSGGRYEAPISPTIERNTWYDFVYHVRWSSGADGFMHAWVNGVKKLTHNGPTLYTGMGCYLKLANYHDPSAASSVIHDRVIRGTTADAVSLTPLQP